MSTSTTRLAPFSSRVVLKSPAVAALAAALLATPVHAAVTWDGDTDGNFNVANNWDADPDTNDDGVLEDGDLIFAGAVQTTVTIDQDYSNISSIVFAGDADTFVLNGNGGGADEILTFNDGATITNNSTVAGDMTFGADLDLVFLGSSATITNNDANGDSAIIFNSSLDLSDTSGVALAVAGTGDVTFNGVISGVGASITYSGSGTLTLAGTNTYDGGFTYTGTGGTLVLADAQGFGSGDLSIGGNVSLEGQGGAINGIQNDIGITSGVTLTISGSENLDIEGDIAGGGSVVINMADASDVVTLGGDNSGLGNGFTLTEGRILVEQDNAFGNASDTLTVDATTGEASIEATGGAVNLAANIVLDGGASELSLNGSENIGVTGVISGAGSLFIGVDATDVVTLSGDNTYSGGTTIDNADAILAVGSDTALGTGDLTLTANGQIQAASASTLANDVVLGANTLTIGGTNDLGLSGAISGTGDVTINATGAEVTLSGTNTYTGTTTLTDGTLVLGGNDAIGNGAGGATFTIDGGTLDVTGDIVLDENVTVGGDFAVADLGGGSLELSGTVDLGNADRTITTSNDEIFELSGVISSTGQDDALIKAGAGVLVLSADNTGWNGGVQLNAGTLGIGDNVALGGGAMDLGGDASVYASGAARSVGNAVDLNTNTLTVTGSNDLTLSGAVSSTGGTGSLTMAGTGTLTLSNIGNSFAGTTTISSGTLAITGNVLGTSSLDLAGGTLSVGGLGAAISTAVSVSEDSTIAGGSSLTLSGVVSGTSDLTIAMDAIGDVVTLSGTNTATGAIGVDSGMLTLAGGAAIEDTVSITLADDAAAGLTLSAGETIGALIGGGSSGGNVVLGANTLTLAGPAGMSASTYSGVISGTGGLTVSGGTHILAGDNTYTGATTLSGGILGGAGSIDGDLTANGGTFAVGTTGTTGDFEVAGNAAFNSGSTLEVTINGNNLNQTDTLVVTGTATLASGSTIDVDIDNVSGTYIPTNALYEVLTAAGGITDNGVSVTTDSATLSFYSLDSFDVDGDFTNGDTSLSVQAIRASNAYSNPSVVDAGNNRLVGAALDSLTVVADGDSSSDAAVLLSQLQGLNAADLNTALSQLSPTAAAAPSTIAQGGVSAFNSVQAGYMTARRQGTVGQFMMASAATSQSTLGLGMTDQATLDPGLVLAGIMQDTASDAGASDADAINGLSDGWRMYAKIYGISSELDTEGNRIGYDGDFYGVQAGLDRDFGGGMFAGIALGYTSSDVDLLGNRGEIEADTFRFGPYFTYQADRWFFDASATIGFTSYDQQRRIAVPGQPIRTALGDYDGEDISIYLGGGYDMPLGESNWQWTPNLSIAYTNYSFDGYTESGAGVSNLVISDRDDDSLRARAGVTFSHKNVEGATFYPEFSVGYEYEFEDFSAVESRFAAGGSNFAVDVGSPVDGAVFAGVGIRAIIDEKWTAFVRYDGLFGDGLDSHALSGGVRFSF